MNDFLNEYKLIVSLVMIAAFVLIRWAVIRLLRSRAKGDDVLLKHWANTTTNATQFIIVIGLIIIWGSELRYAALSVAAFIVAIVIATREFIQNFLGAVYLASSRPFSIGEWISIDGHVGEVVRSDWLTTAILEVDMEGQSYAYTGKTLIIPNNQFVVKTVYNLNYMRRYISHTFSIVREAEHVNVFEIKELILARAKEYSRSFTDVAERYNSLIETRLGIEITGPEASVRISTNDTGRNVFTISLFCPTEKAVFIEQKLTEDFMLRWYQLLEQPQLQSGETATRDNNSNE
jgi:small-conductance mechanosensitive channel